MQGFQRNSAITVKWWICRSNISWATFEGRSNPTQKWHKFHYLSMVMDNWIDKKQTLNFRAANLR